MTQVKHLRNHVNGLTKIYVDLLFLHSSLSRLYIMPPRKTAECKSLKRAEVLEPLTAARRVYGMPEVRDNILGQLTKKDLASFLRVEKGVMEDVAKVLY